MPTETPDLENVLKRLEKLEKENRDLKLAGVLALLFVVMVVVLGVIVERMKVPETVVARSFVLQDETGRVRATLGIEGTAGLRLFRSGGEEGAALQLSETGGDLQIRGPRGSAISISADEPRLRMIDSQGFRAILGETEIVTPETGQSAHTSAASLILFDKDGRGIWKAP